MTWILAATLLLVPGTGHAGTLGALRVLDDTASLMDLKGLKPDSLECRHVLSLIERSMRRLQPYSNRELDWALRKIQSRAIWTAPSTPGKSLIELYPRVGNESREEYVNRLSVRARDDEFKAVLVTRFLFEVPQRDKSIGFPYTPMVENTYAHGSLDRLAPFQRLPDGSLRLVGKIEYYYDTPYMPVQEFEFYAQHYKRRPRWW